ncbi:transglycosylase SLT domain-containing protein [Salinarimonas soli]|nr:transglycosylase SLT domain-containing protein [Salinarimonas soli]
MRAGARLVLRAAAVVLCCAALPLGAAKAEHTAERAVANPHEALAFGEMKVARWLAETVVRAAEVTEVDPALLMAMADKESSFRPDIRASTSSAEGLFQFLDATWLEVLKRYGAKHGYAAAADAIRPVKGRLSVSDADRAWILSLRRDPFLAAVMAGEMIRSTQETLLAANAERNVSGTDIYLAHFLGVNGASRFLDLMDDSPQQAAPSAFPRAAKANRTLFFSKPTQVAEAEPKKAEAGPKADEAKKDEAKKDVSSKDEPKGNADKASADKADAKGAPKDAAKGKAVATAKAMPKSLAEVHALLAAVMDKRVARYENAARDLGTRQYASAAD